MTKIPGLRPLSDAEMLGIQLAESELQLIDLLVAGREAKGWSQSDLAREIGVDRSVITRFEAGGTNPTMATINRYAEAVGVMISYDVQPWRTWQTETVKRRADCILYGFSRQVSFAQTSSSADAFFRGILAESQEENHQTREENHQISFHSVARA